MLKIQSGVREWLAVLTALFLFMMTISQTVLADNIVHDSTRFVWTNVNSSSNVIVTHVANTNRDSFHFQFNLFQNEQKVTSKVTAKITDPDGVVKDCLVNVTSNEYDITVTPDILGTYSVSVEDSQGNETTGYIITVPIEPSTRVETTGCLVMNTYSPITLKLLDIDRIPIAMGSITLDGTAVGVGSQTVTTIGDGTANFAMTPTQLGVVKIIYGNEIIGGIAVMPASTNIHVSTIGTPMTNSESTLTVKLTDSAGSPLEDKSVTIDGMAAGASPVSQTYTTLNDGTVTFKITPTQLGNIKIVYAGDIVGVIPVVQDKYTMTVNGSLFANTNNTITVKLTNSLGNPLQQKSVTIDGTAVSATPNIQTLTTLNDGTITLTITPAQLGNISIVYAGDIVGVIPVVQDKYTMTVNGSLFANTSNTITVKLTDSLGNPLLRKSVTVDGTAVSSTPATQTLTTLNDGTFTLTTTPTQTGKVTVAYSGEIIGEIVVNPAITFANRIGGQTKDNVALSVEVARQGWSSATNVILTRDDEFTDAMAAVPLSKNLNAPILMTGSEKLDDRTFGEMQELGVSNVYIIGGSGAISQDIENRLQDYFAVKRIAGPQRYETAVAISKNMGIEVTHTAYIANGYAIPDAIAASALAAEQGNAILLTDKDKIPASTLDALANLNVSHVVLLGGTGVISPQVENELSSQYAVERWGGTDRYETQEVILENLYKSSPTPQSPLYFTSGLVRQDDVSSGKPYADALLTAALAAKTDGFVAMVPPNNLPSSVYFFLLYNKSYITKAEFVGNISGGVSVDIERQIKQILER